MIDYEMLETARKLCSKLYDYYFTLDFCINTNNPYLIDIKLVHLSGSKESFDSFVRLIQKLTELTKPEPKYKIGDKVFITWHGYIEEARIVDKTSHDRYQVMINDGGKLSRVEDEIFPTRQELIEHQINYWQALHSDNELKFNDGGIGYASHHKSENVSDAFTYIGCVATPKPSITPCKTCGGHGDMRLYAGLGKYVVFESCCHQPKCNHVIDPDNQICMTCHEYILPKGFGYDGHKITPDADCEPKQCHHKYTKGICVYCGDEDIFGENFLKPEGQSGELHFRGDKEKMARQFAEMEDNCENSTLPIVDVGRCEHVFTLGSGFSCHKCGENIIKANAEKPLCNHKSDGMIYPIYPPQNKCIKCGEFYR